MTKYNYTALDVAKRAGLLAELASLRAENERLRGELINQDKMIDALQIKYAGYETALCQIAKVYPEMKQCPYCHDDGIVHPNWCPAYIARAALGEGGK